MFFNSYIHTMYYKHNSLIFQAEMQRKLQLSFFVTFSNLLLNKRGPWCMMKINKTLCIAPHFTGASNLDGGILLDLTAEKKKITPGSAAMEMLHIAPEDVDDYSRRLGRNMPELAALLSGAMPICAPS